MANLDDTVLSVVRDFVASGSMFTALDVSNKVKESMPQARHSSVRDVVRTVYAAEIESNGYARTPITVTLADGNTAEALLYHSLSDSWDLDAKYDAQKRAATSARPVTNVTPTTVSPVNTTAPAVTATAVVVPVTPLTPHDAWNKMFQTQPSLFARKSNV